LPSPGALRCIACIETCKRCGGKLRVIASIEDPVVIERILGHLGRDEGPADPAPARQGKRGPHSSRASMAFSGEAFSAAILRIPTAVPRSFEHGRKVGFEVEERRVRAHGRKGTRHLIWIATKR